MGSPQRLHVSDRLVPSSHAALTSRFRDQAGERAAKPPDDSARELAQIRAAAKAAGQGSELARFAIVPDCERAIYVQRVGSFMNWIPVCYAHHWAGQPTSCEHGAAAQICEHRLHAQIAAARVERLQRAGFVRFDGE